MDWQLAAMNKRRPLYQKTKFDNSPTTMHAVQTHMTVPRPSIQPLTNATKPPMPQKISTRQAIANPVCSVLNR